MLITSLIVEDEPLARKTLRELIEATPWLKLLGEVEDGKSAVLKIDELKPQLLFLDIDLPELNGLQILERISYQPQVVFTTAHDKYAVSAFEFDALDYLLKPYGRQRFQQTLERVRRRLTFSDEQLAAPQDTIDRAKHALATDTCTMLTRIFVREGDIMLPIAMSDIIRLEACDDYTAIYLSGVKYLVHVSLTDFTARLDPATFLRVHRSHTVNINHVTSVEEFDRRLILYLDDGSEVTASRSGTQEFRRLYTWV